MPKEQAKKFIEHLDKDAALRAKVRAATEGVLHIAKEHGYDLTREELSEVLREKWGARKRHEESGDDPDTCFVSEPPGA